MIAKAITITVNVRNPTVDMIEIYVSFIQLILLLFCCFGVDVGNFHLTDINYADAVLFTDDPTKLDYVFRNFEASAGVMGLHTNCAYLVLTLCGLALRSTRKTRPRVQRTSP